MTNPLMDLNTIAVIVTIGVGIFMAEEEVGFVIRRRA